MNIDPSAKIAPDVELAPDVAVGPGVIIDGPTSIGPGTRILAHAYIGPYTTIGAGNLIGFGAVVGYDPQDYAFSGEESYTIIGDHNRIREYVTIHRGTVPGSATRVGNHNFLMALSHMAHNSSLGDHVVVVNGALVGGYVEVADRAFISANCLLHQFIRMGTLAIMRGGSRASRDIPPYSVIDETHTVMGVNLVGLKRAGLASPNIAALRQAFRILFFRRGNLKAATERVEREVSLTPEVIHLLSFIRASKRGVALGPKDSRDANSEP
ncbi:MAG: acyl-ACP--UDP-N-acetylglucosamine O-acyltransferase [Deltaproteobacteria bacterium]